MTNKQLIDMFHNSKYLNFMEFLQNEIEFINIDYEWDYNNKCPFCKEDLCSNDECIYKKEL